MTYMLLNVCFMVILFAALLASGRLQQLRPRPLLITLGILLITTAVFDSIIVQLGLVTYDTAKILGIYIGKAPVEDFGYAIVAVGLVPVLWKLNGRDNE